MLQRLFKTETLPSPAQSRLRLTRQITPMSLGLANVANSRIWVYGPGLAVCLLLALMLGCSSEQPDRLIASARSYLAKGQREAAVIELKRALDKAPTNGEARLMLAATLLEDGDPAGAEVEYRKAREQQAGDDRVVPGLARALLQAGQGSRVLTMFSSTHLSEAAAEADLRTTCGAVYAQQGDHARADAELAVALRAVPLYPPAVMVQARMLADAGKVDEALALLDGVLAQDPGNEQVGVAKGYLMWLGKRDAQGALQAHRRVLAAKPGNVAAQSEIVTLLFAQGQHAEARQAFEALRKIAPKHAQTLFFDAQFAYVDRQYGRARELLDALLKAMPDHYRALELAAASEYQLGHDVQAQGFAARALKTAPGLVLARQIVAQSYLRTGHASKALEALTPLLEGERADAESLALAGSAYMQLGEAGKADVAFKRAKQLAPSNSKVRTAAALADLSGGRADIALRELQAIAHGDQGARGDLALISARIAQGDMKGALVAIDGLQAKTPQSALPHQLRGQVLVSLRDADHARASFEAALKLDAKYFPALAALAAMDVASGKVDAARKRVEGFSKANPTHARALMLQADLAQAAGALPPEVTRLQAEAVRADPTDPDAHWALVRRHMQLADRTAALAAAQAAVAAMPSDLRLLESLGQAQLLAGEAQQALSTFRKLVTARPPSAPLQMAVAEAHLAANDLEGARRALKKALEIDGEFSQARRSLAMLALQERHPDEALALARDMQKRQPNGALGYAVEGDIEVSRRNWPQAATAYRAALQRSKASEAAVKLHAVLRAAGNGPEADRWAAEWEKKRPADPVFRFYLGDLAMSQRDYPAAETQYRAVLAAQPANAMAMNNVAWLLHKQSRPGALEMAQKANAALPNRAPLLDTLATIQGAQGQVDDAIATQRRAVAASPQDPNLRLGLARHLLQGRKRDEARDLLDALARLGDKFGDQAEVSALRRTL